MNNSWGTRSFGLDAKSIMLNIDRGVGGHIRRILQFKDTNVKEALDVVLGEGWTYKEAKKQCQFITVINSGIEELMVNGTAVLRFKMGDNPELTVEKLWKKL